MWYAPLTQLTGGMAEFQTIRYAQLTPTEQDQASSAPAGEHTNQPNHWLATLRQLLMTTGRRVQRCRYE